MRVVSMVPSWTETLLLADVNVVGRTRFCIHPKDSVASIPAIGGTKDWKWDRILELKPDLLILDKEENPLFMSEQQEIPWCATHVTSIQDVPQALRELQTALKAPKLEEFAQRWEKVLQRPAKASWNKSSDFPGLIEWGKKPTQPIQNILYVIWREPWMIVSQDTFIGSVLQQVGIQIPRLEKKYPEIDLNQYDPNSTLLLFSSEPFPFLKKKDEVASLGFPHAFVDGESFSWFGVRSLNFLEAALA